MRILPFCLAFLTSITASAADDARLGAPISVPGASHLQVFPIVDSAPDVGPDYRLLDDALKAGALTVHEKGTSGQVSELRVTYTGGQPIYALAGEVLLGGKQDRIVAEPTVIPAGAENFAVPVFCVEQGRWASGGSLKFAAGQRLAHTSLRQMAHKKSQSAVWAEVAKTNEKRDTGNTSDTYRAAIQDTAHTVKVDAMVKALLARTRAVEKMTGLLVAVNGEAVAFDRFATARLYRKLEPKLVRSYIAEALDAGKASAKRLDAAGAQRFIESTKQGKRQTDRRVGNDILRLDNDAVEGNTVMSKSKRALHYNFFKRKAETAPTKRQLRRRRATYNDIDNDIAPSRVSTPPQRRQRIITPAPVQRRQP